MEIIEDLVAEQDRIESILSDLDEAGWASPSLCPGWSISDVVLHLAQTQEAAAATLQTPVRDRSQAVAATGVDAAAGRAVEAERRAPEAIFARWRAACRAFEAAFADSEPDSLVQWVGGTLRPATLATTRLAEHWAHGLDIATPLGVSYPDTNRLRHIAWLGHRTLAYAFTISGQTPREIYCELTAPEGEEIWRLGPSDSSSSIRGDGGAFCRVGAQRLSPADSGLITSGPHAEGALAVLRNYAA